MAVVGRYITRKIHSLLQSACALPRQKNNPVLPGISCHIWQCISPPSLFLCLPSSILLDSPKPAASILFSQKTAHKSLHLSSIVKFHFSVIALRGDFMSAITEKHWHYTHRKLITCAAFVYRAVTTQQITFSIFRFMVYSNGFFIIIIIVI